MLTPNQEALLQQFLDNRKAQRKNFIKRAQNLPLTLEQKKMLEDNVTITKEEYEELTMSKKILDSLKKAGVNNWEGYADSMKSMEKDLDHHFHVWVFLGGRKVFSSDDKTEVLYHTEDYVCSVCGLIKQYKSEPGAWDEVNEYFKNKEAEESQND